jgi:hypothetical protein
LLCSGSLIADVLSTRGSTAQLPDSQVLTPNRGNTHALSTNQPTKTASGMRKSCIAVVFLTVFSALKRLSPPPPPPQRSANIAIGIKTRNRRTPDPHIALPHT